MEINFPEHDAGLYISHNDHKASYMGVEDAIGVIYDDDDWISQEEKEKAIRTDSVWSIQWYPDTPNHAPFGSCIRLSSTFEGLFEGD